MIQREVRLGLSGKLFFRLLEVNYSLTSLHDHRIDVGGDMAPTGELPVGVIFLHRFQVEPQLLAN